MMIKIFTTGKDGKISLTGKELKELLDEAYWEGYRANSHTITWTTPSWTPYYYTTCSDGYTISTSNAAKNVTSDNITINAKDYNSGITFSNTTSNGVTVDTSPYTINASADYIVR
jgi:hypothetical protein